MISRAPGEQTRTLKIEHAARRKRHDQTHRLRRIGLRPRYVRYSREGGSTRCQMQKSSAGKFHLEPPSRFTSLDHLVGEREQRRRNVRLHQSALAPANLMTFAHLSVSSVMRLAYSLGE